jgi:hypothetical protein
VDTGARPRPRSEPCRRLQCCQRHDVVEENLVCTQLPRRTGRLCSLSRRLFSMGISCRSYGNMLRFLDPPYTVGCLFLFKDKNCRSHVRREESWVGRGVVDLWQALSTSTSYCALTFSRGPPVLAVQPSGRNWVVIGGEKEERGGVAGWRCCCLLLSRQGIKAPRH